MSPSIFNKIDQRVQEQIFADKPDTDSFWQILLIPLSLVYQTIVRIRTGLYSWGLLKSYKLSCPVISIGNITVGGTGKTPMAQYIAGLVKDMGLKPVIISRGYKGKKSRQGGIVSDGATRFMTPDDCGDEPFMMASAIDIPVIIGRDRYRAGTLAVEKFQPDVIILDDGFSHLRLQRELDIILLDFHRPLGNKHFLPAGPLRESLHSCLKRAGMVIFTRCPEKTPFQRPLPGSLNALLQQKLPVYHSVHTPRLSRLLNTNNTVSVESLADLTGKEVLAFSGLARNQAFHDTLKDLGVMVRSHLEFSDHYRYKKEDLVSIEQTAEQLDVDIIITTEKDFTRIDKNRSWSKHLAVIGIQIRFIEKEDELRNKIERMIHA